MIELIQNKGRIGRVQTILTRKDGSVVAVNKARMYEQPFFLCTNPPNNDVAVAANSQSSAQVMRVSAEGPVQITDLSAVRDATHGAVDVKFQLADGQNIIELMNGFCHIDTIFGNAGQTYTLPEGLYIDENRALNAIFVDLTGSGTNVRINGVAGKYTALRLDPTMQRVKQRMQQNQYLSLPFWYTTDDGPITLTGLQAVEKEIQIDNNHNFAIHQIGYLSTSDDFAMDIIDLAKGESIVNAPSNTNYSVPRALLTGDNKYQFKLNQPWTIFAGQKLLIRLQDLSGSSNTVRIVFGGQALLVRQWQ